MSDDRAYPMPGAWKMVRQTARQNAKELLQKIGLDTVSPIQFENQPNCPIVIMGAGVKVVTRPKDAQADIAGSQDDEYEILSSVRLANATAKPIIAFGLYFTKAGEKPDDNPLIVSARFDAYSSYTFHKIHKDEWSQWLSNPEEVVVKIAGVVFQDKTIWEEGPKSKYIYDEIFTRNHIEPPSQDVDQKPLPLTHPRPGYTEEMRENKIQGLVLMRVLVGADGVVKQVRIIAGLPDGANEEAIIAVRQMRFQPAMKDGAAVECWVNVEMEFNLR